MVTVVLPRLLYALAGDGVMAHPKLEAEAAEMHAVPLFGDFTQESHCVNCGSVKKRVKRNICLLRGALHG